MQSRSTRTKLGEHSQRREVARQSTSQVSEVKVGTSQGRIHRANVHRQNANSEREAQSQCRCRSSCAVEKVEYGEKGVQYQAGKCERREKGFSINRVANRMGNGYGVSRVAWVGIRVEYGCRNHTFTNTYLAVYESLTCSTSVLILEFLLCSSCSPLSVCTIVLCPSFRSSLLDGMYDTKAYSNMRRSVVFPGALFSS
jgi:hypothetical protein